MASGWNLWVWLVGVAVRRYIDILITFPYSTCISSFLAAASLLLCSFFKCFFVLVILIWCHILKLVSRAMASMVKAGGRGSDWVTFTGNEYIGYS